MSSGESSIRKRRIRQRIGLILGTVISAFCLVLVARGVQLAEIIQALKETSLGYLALALLTYVISVWIRAYRWQLLFYPHQKQVRINKLTSVILIGQMINIWLFTRVGDLARAYLIGEIEGVSKAGAFGTIVLEKSFDSLLLLLLLGLLALFMPLPGWLQMSSILLSGALALLLFILLIAAQYRERIIALGNYLIHKVPRLGSLDLSRRLIAAGDSLEPLRRMDVNLKLLGWSALFWVISALTNQFTLQAMGIAVPWYVSFFLLVVFQVGGIIPASPGRFGVYHYLAVEALALFNVPRGLALSFAILLHFITYVLMSVAGAWCLWKENYDLQHVIQLAPSQAQHTSGAPVDKG